MEIFQAVFDSPWLKLIDVVITIYLVYYYIRNEYEKGNFS